MTQAQLAKELGVSIVTITRWETQSRKPQLLQYGKFLQYCEKKLSSKIRAKSKELFVK